MNYKYILVSILIAAFGVVGMYFLLNQTTLSLSAEFVASDRTEPVSSIIDTIKFLAEATSSHATHVAGTIAASGIRMIVEAKIDYSKAKNLVLTALVFVTGISGISVNIGQSKLSGMVLATLVGMALSLIFYVLEKLKLTNDVTE